MSLSIWMQEWFSKEVMYKSLFSLQLTCGYVIKQLYKKWLITEQLCRICILLQSEYIEVNSNVFIQYIDLKIKICIQDKSLEIWNRVVYEVQLQKLFQTLVLQIITSPRTQNSFSSDLNQISFSKSMKSSMVWRLQIHITMIGITCWTR